MSIGFGSSFDEYNPCSDWFTIMEQSNKIKALSKKVQYYEETELKLHKLTGFNLDELVTIFAKGYTLTPPQTASMAD